MSTLRMIGELALNASGWHTGLDRAEKAGNAFGKRVSSTLSHHLAAAFGTHMLVHQAKEVMEYGAHIYDASKALQVSKKDLQEFDYAAKTNGATLEDLQMGFKGLAKARREALEGNQEKLGIFKALGISRDALQKQGLGDTFRQIGEAFRTKDFGANELGIALQVLGRHAEALLPMFKAGLAEASAEAEHLGLVLRDDVVDALKQSHDELTKLIFRLRGPFAESIAFAARQGQKLVGWLETAGTFWGGFSVDPHSEITRSKDFWGSLGRRWDNANSSVDAEAKQRAAADAADAEFKKQQQGDRARSYFEFQDAKATEEAKKVLHIREQIYDIRRKTAMRGLDENQKEERLLNEIWRKRMEIDKMRREGKPESEQLEKQKDMAHLQDELANLREDRRKHEAEFGILKPQDSLAKIGGFTQFADAYLPLKTPLERIATATEATAANTGNRSGLLDPAGLIGGGF